MKNLSAEQKSYLTACIQLTVQWILSYIGEKNANQGLYIFLENALENSLVMSKEFKENKKIFFSKHPWSYDQSSPEMKALIKISDIPPECFPTSRFSIDISGNTSELLTVVPKEHMKHIVLLNKESFKKMKKVGGRYLKELQD